MTETKKQYLYTYKLPDGRIETLKSVRTYLYAVAVRVNNDLEHPIYKTWWIASQHATWSLARKAAVKLESCPDARFNFHDWEAQILTPISRKDV